MRKAVAVIDIGMTNKKISLWDEKLNLLAMEKRGFEPVLVEGLETHDLAGMESWFLATLAGFSSSYDIESIAVCTHGATFVCTDAEGNPVAPCVYYTHEPGPEFHARFYSLAGDRRTLQEVTGTPDFSALINPAKGLFFLKERFPAEFSRAELVLAYPQYWGMRLTGRAGAEGTYIGCHTYLFDWKKSNYSIVAEKLGLAGKLPAPIRTSWETLGTLKPEIARQTGLSPNTLVTMGIHDSNASLLPYIIKEEKQDFVVDSTGTWCVLMHPQQSYGFAPEELGKVVFFNRSAYNTPVKTAIFLGGKEYEVWTELASAYRRSRLAGAPAHPADTAAALGGGLSAAQNAAVGGADSFSVLQSVIADAAEFILPEIVPGSGQFPGSIAGAVEHGKFFSQADIARGLAHPEFIMNEQRAEAVLNLSLVLQTLVALERAGLSAGESVFIEGGFRNNRQYAVLLASALPENPIFLTDMKEATSYGAALTAISAVSGKAPGALAPLIHYEKESVLPLAGLSGFENYQRIWLGQLAQHSTAADTGESV